MKSKQDDDTPETRILYRVEETKWSRGREGGNVTISIPIDLTLGWPEWDRHLFPTVVIREDKWIELQRGVRDFFCPNGGNQYVGFWLAAYLLETAILADPDAIPLGEDTSWCIEPPLDQVDRLRFIDPRKARRIVGLWYVCGRERRARTDGDHAGVATIATASSNDD